MDTHTPKVFTEKAAHRRPFEWHDQEALTAQSLDERKESLLRSLAEADSRPRVDLPEEPSGAGRSRKRPVREDDPKAVSGRVAVERGAWVAKYNPNRADYDDEIYHSDVFRDFEWADRVRALEEPWIHSQFMRGAAQAIPRMHEGDLVFAIRTDWFDPEWDPTELRRRTVVGLWVVESVLQQPAISASGKPTVYGQVACVPVRRFDFPVPIGATSQADEKFDRVAAFHDRSHKSLLELTTDETLAVARNCGLPAAVLSLEDTGRLIARVEHLDLGPPFDVRRRIREGARAAAHRSTVEKSARDMVVAELLRLNMGVVSTESRRGVGSDLWTRGLNADGTTTEARIEVKGLSGTDPLGASLTKAELDAAITDAGAGRWWLAVVTNALRNDRKLEWLDSGEVARIYSTTRDGKNYTADRRAA